MPVRLSLNFLLVAIMLWGTALSGIAAPNESNVPNEPREYRFQADPKIKHADGEPGKAWLSITRNAEGFFSISGGVAYFTEGMMNFAGGGVLESDGLIHFAWENVLGKGGRGTLRFTESGKNVVLLLGEAENNPAWNLAWTEKPLASAHFVPTSFHLTTPREYEYTTKEGKYEISTIVTISSTKDGKFEIGGHLYRTPGKAIDFGGSGLQGKDGVIHFAWEDSFEKKGNGTLRFLEEGKKVVFRMGATHYEWILTWTGKPIGRDASRAK